MISVESKTFEFGVMRMVGLSKSGLIYMIILQGIMFVVPSLLMGFVFSFPALALINSFLFDRGGEFQSKIAPAPLVVL